MSRRAAAVAALGLLVAGQLLSPATVRADGDPASDVLLGQSVFLGYGTVSHAVAGRLYAVSAAAAAHGYPVRVAVIGARTDLGTVPVLFGRPARYARFLSSELPQPGPVLVVMPQGFGLARGGRALPAGALTGLRVSPAADSLAAAAVTAVERLAAAAGHPLPPGAATSTGSGGASAGTIRHALIGLGVLALLAAAGIAAGWRARGRAAA